MSAARVSVADARALAESVELPQALVFGALTSALATVGHLAGGGAMVAVVAATAIFPAAVGLRRLLGRCRCSLPGLVAATGALQLGGHLLLAHTVGPGGPALVPACGGQLPSLLPPADPPFLLSGQAMVAAHLLATLLTAWWLWQGERLVVALGAWVLTHCRLVAPPRALVRPLTRVAARTPVTRLHSALVGATAASRAPPRPA